nr:hypothetical protein A5482_00245 [Cyanobacterium sp. IPPAS B-1200]
MKICLLWATVYSGNMGVNALTYSALTYLEKLSQMTNQKYQYILIGTGKNAIVEDKIEINSQELHFKFYPIYGYTNRTALIKPKSLSFYQEVKEADLIIDLGEGDSFTDIYGEERFKKLFITKLYCLLLKKKIALFPQTIGPFNKQWTRLCANFILGKMTAIYVRDDLSYEYCIQNIPNYKTLKKFTDLAFYLPFEQCIFNHEKMNIGLNISGLLWNGGYNTNNQFALQVNYPQMITNILDLLNQKNNCLIHLIPHVISPSFPIDDDYEVCQKLHLKYSQTILAPSFTSPIEAKSYISGCDLFIGSRMHSCIAALSAGVPVIPIAYSRKFTGLFDYTLKYPYVIDATKKNDKYVINQLDKYMGNREEMLTKVKESTLLIEKYNQDFFEELSYLIK